MTFRAGGRLLTQEEIDAERAKYGRVRSDGEVMLEKAKLDHRRIGMMLLANEDGKLLMEKLEQTFYRGSMLGETPEKTYFNLGQREVVDFLLSLRDQAKKE